MRDVREQDGRMYDVRDRALGGKLAGEDRDKLARRRRNSSKCSPTASHTRFIASFTGTAKYLTRTILLPRRARLDSLAMGPLTFSINVTLDGCIDHREGIADDETHAYFTRLMDESGAVLWGRTTYESR